VSGDWLYRWLGASKEAGLDTYDPGLLARVLVNGGSVQGWPPELSALGEAFVREASRGGLL
jgi:hypothetical protein